VHAAARASVHAAAKKSLTNNSRNNANSRPSTHSRPSAATISSKVQPSTHTSASAAPSSANVQSSVPSRTSDAPVNTNVPPPIHSPTTDAPTPPPQVEQQQQVECEPIQFAWNGTPSSLQMQSHVMWHSCGQPYAGFDVESILTRNRMCFGEPGPLEMSSFQFLMSAACGDVCTVVRILNDGLVNVDVADGNGQTALIGAAVSVSNNRLSVNLSFNHFGCLNEGKNMNLMTASTRIEIIGSEPVIFE